MAYFSSIFNDLRPRVLSWKCIDMKMFQIICRFIRIILHASSSNLTGNLFITWANSNKRIAHNVFNSVDGNSRSHNSTTWGRKVTTCSAQHTSHSSLFKRLYSHGHRLTISIIELMIYPDPTTLTLTYLFPYKYVFAPDKIHLGC